MPKPNGVWEQRQTATLETLHRVYNEYDFDHVEELALELDLPFRDIDRWYSGEHSPGSVAKFDLLMARCTQALNRLDKKRSAILIADDPIDTFDTVNDSAHKELALTFVIGMAAGAAAISVMGII